MKYEFSLHMTKGKVKDWKNEIVHNHEGIPDSFYYNNVLLEHLDLENGSSTFLRGVYENSKLKEINYLDLNTGSWQNSPASQPLTFIYPNPEIDGVMENGDNVEGVYLDITEKRRLFHKYYNFRYIKINDKIFLHPDTKTEEFKEFEKIIEDIVCQVKK